MKFASFRKSTSRGFGLLEVILVFALVIGAAAVVFSVFQSAKPAADASNEDSNLSTLATNLKSTYGINHNYTGLTNSTAIKAKIVPSSMTDGTNVFSQWGPVTINSSTSSRFVINYTNVPTDACSKFVTGAAGLFEGINVGTTPLTNTSRPNVDQAMLVTACNTSNSVSINFFGR